MKKFRTKYDRVRVKSFGGLVSMTDQQYKDECSIDGIIKRYGVLPQREPVTLNCGDCSSFGDYADCMEKVVVAREQFEALPAAVRERFGHDPVAFYRFVSDPKNLDEGVRLGLYTLRQDEKDPVAILEKIADGVSSKEPNEAQ